MVKGSSSGMKNKTIYIIIAAIIIVLLVIFLYPKNSSDDGVQNNSNNLMNNTANSSTSVGDNAVLYQNVNHLPGCTETDSLLDPGVIGTTTDKTGSFTDRCDSQGNLIEYYCAVTSNTGNSQLGIEAFTANKTIDCGGKCSYGKCANQCPGIGNFLTYTKIDSGTGKATFSDNFGKAYSCDLSETSTPSNYDCKADPSVGTKVKVVGNLGSDGYCTSNSFTMSAFDTSHSAETSTCYYSCAVA